MSRDYYPRREVDILGWTANFRLRIQTDPQALGLTQVQSDAYTLAQQRFADLYAAAHSPTERTPSVIAAKQTARIELEAQTRVLVGIICSHPDISLHVRITLGVAIRGRGGYRRALPPPDHAPRLRVRDIEGRIATIALFDRESGKRRKPRGAYSAHVWSFAGEVPPVSIRAWTFAGSTTRTINRIALGVGGAGHEPGTKIWIAAGWVNSRGKRGPLCDPVLAFGSEGVTMPMRDMKSARMLVVPSLPKPDDQLAQETPELKLAA